MWHGALRLTVACAWCKVRWVVPGPVLAGAAPRTHLRRTDPAPNNTRQPRGTARGPVQPTRRCTATPAQKHHGKEHKKQPPSHPPAMGAYSANSVFMTPMPRVAVSMALRRPSRPRVAMRKDTREVPSRDGCRSIISPCGWCVWGGGGESAEVNSGEGSSKRSECLVGAIRTLQHRGLCSCIIDAIRKVKLWGHRTRTLAGTRPCAYTRVSDSPPPHTHTPCAAPTRKRLLLLL